MRYLHASYNINWLIVFNTNEADVSVVNNWEISEAESKQIGHAMKESIFEPGELATLAVLPKALPIKDYVLRRIDANFNFSAFNQLNLLLKSKKYSDVFQDPSLYVSEHFVSDSLYSPYYLGPTNHAMDSIGIYVLPTKLLMPNALREEITLELQGAFSSEEILYRVIQNVGSLGPFLNLAKNLNTRFSLIPVSHGKNLRHIIKGLREISGRMKNGKIL